MNNFKIHYLVYVVVIGLAFGWLIATIIGANIASPKPTPTVKKVEADDRIPLGTLARNAIDSNIFSLGRSTDVGAVSSTNSGANAGDSTGADNLSSFDAPPPPFSAALLGIFQRGLKNSGYAIIQLDNGTIVLHTGETKNNLTLLSLDVTSALVERDNRKYSLVLAGSLATASKGNNGKQPTTTTAPVTQGSNINVTLARNDIKDELKDLNKVLQSALVSPFYKDGEYLGYRVARMKAESPLAKLGLKQGDVITRINGSELKSPEPLFGMLGQIDEISAISIDMIRENEKKSIFVEIN